MAIPLNDNIKVNAPKPSEERYLNNINPYSSTTQVDLATIGRRYTGLTVNINGEEYWYKNTINDGGLVLKSSSNSIIGSGTTGYHSKFNSSSGLTNSVLYDDGINLGLNTTAPFNGGGGVKWFTLNGNANFSSGIVYSQVDVQKMQHYVDNDSYFTHQAGAGIGQKFITNASRTMTLTPANNVLIGGTLDNGIDRLQVSGTTLITGDAKINGLTVGRGAGGISTNTTLGYGALMSNLIGVGITAIGSGALAVNTADSNTGLGGFALANTTNGSSNVAVGFASLLGNTNGFGNVGVGHWAGRYIADGVTDNASGNNNIYLGYLTKSLAAGQSNEIVIGSGVIGLGTNSVIIGGPSIVKTSLNGNVLIGSTFNDGINQLQVSGYTIASGYRTPSGTSSQFLMADGSTSTVNPDNITGSGTTNYLTKFSSSTAITNSQIFDTGNNILIATLINNGVDKLQVSGSIKTNSSTSTNASKGLKVLDSGSNPKFEVYGNNHIDIFRDSNADISNLEGIIINGASTAYGSNSSNRGIITFMQWASAGNLVTGIQAGHVNHGNVNTGVYFVNGDNIRMVANGGVGGAVSTIYVTRIPANNDTTVNIGTETSINAKFNVVSTTLGSAPFPRMTEAQRLAIATSEGLYVYQTNNVAGLYQYTSGAWRNLTFMSTSGTTNRLAMFNSVSGLTDSPLSVVGTTVLMPYVAGSYNSNSFGWDGVSGGLQMFLGGGTTAGLLSTRSGAFTVGVNHATGFLAFATTNIERVRINPNGNFLLNTTNDTGEKLQVSGSSRFVNSGVGTTVLISSTTQNSLVVIGSGNSTTNPIFSVQGSQGELFSVNDSLTGSLFSVNDISGLPVIEAFSDNTILMGSFQAPSLNTTVKTLANVGVTNIYSIPTSAYTGAWIDYTVNNGSSLRAGSLMSVFSGTNVQYTETSTNDIGNTSGITFSMIISGASAIYRASGTTAGWTIKSIIRSI